MPVNSESTSDWGGACYKIGKSSIKNSYGGNSYNQTKAGFDASLVTNRYGDYTEVNPLYESCLICISY